MVLVATKYSNDKVKIRREGNQDEEEVYLRSKETFHGKYATVLANGAKEQVPLEKAVCLNG